MPSSPHARTRAHTHTHTQGHVSRHAVQGSFRSQMNKVLGYFLLLMSVLLTFIMQHGRELAEISMLRSFKEMICGERTHKETHVHTLTHTQIHTRAQSLEYIFTFMTVLQTV